MTYNIYVKSKTTGELQAELKDLTQAIDNFECFGWRDLILRGYITVELNNRKEALEKT